MTTQYLELNPWHKRQAAILHHFTSMEYLQSLLPKADQLLALIDRFLDERSHLDTAGRALAGWEPRSTAAHFSTLAHPALIEFREGIVASIAMRSLERYRGAGDHQCARMLEEYAYPMTWATHEQEDEFRELANVIFREARKISSIVARPTTLNDFSFWRIWSERHIETHQIPRFRVRTDVAARSDQTPPRTGIYVAKDDPLSSLQFAWTGGYGELGPVVTLNSIGHLALKEVGRRGLWEDGRGLYEFFDANRHLDIQDWLKDDLEFDEAACYSLAPSMIASSSFEDRECEWYFVEPVPGEFEEIDGSYAGADAGNQRPNRFAAGKPVPASGWWYTPAQGSRRYFQQGAVFPSIENSDWGDTFWIWASDQTPPRMG